MLNESDLRPALTESGINKFVKTILGILIILLFIFGSFKTLILWLDTPPPNFPTSAEITIEPGLSARATAEKLHAQNYVRSAYWLYLTLILKHNPSEIKASTYVFNVPESTSRVAAALIEGGIDSNLIKVTLLEGESINTYARELESTLSEFSAEEFITLAKPFEGKLFPETYHIPPTFTAKEMFDLMLNTFTERIASIDAQINDHPLSLEEILILASIIEREANTETSMKMVSGILQERLRIGMALQVDASMEYVLDKPLSKLTAADLEIDSPYNTYLYNGLPPTPIGNPGLTAIKAVLEPTSSPYLFYITGNDGEFYYGRNFDEHRTNIARYLR